MFFKAVVQVVLFFGVNMWVMTPYMDQALWGVSTQGILADHWETAPEVIGQDLGVSASVDSDSGGGV